MQISFRLTRIDENRTKSSKDQPQTRNTKWKQIIHDRNQQNKMKDLNKANQRSTILKKNRQYIFKNQHKIVVNLLKSLKIDKEPIRINASKTDKSRKT